MIPRQEPPPKPCANCGEAIERGDRQLGNFRKQRYCSRKCWAAASRLSVEGLEPPVRMGKFWVYRTEEGRPFTLNSSGVRVGRLYGYVDPCARCGKDFFHRDTGSPRWRHCSKKCAIPALRAAKHAAALKKSNGPRRDALDKWFSAIVRSVGLCHRCGSRDNLQCAHIVSRRYLGVRFDFENAVCLCAKCHMFFTHRPLEWDEYVQDRIMGADAYAALRLKARQFQGPLDRREVARVLYARAMELGVTIRGAAGATFAGVYDSESERAYREGAKGANP